MKEEHQKILNDFISEHSPLIKQHINILKSKGKIPQHIEHDDLIMAGVHGLVESLHKYDSEAGAKLAKPDENPFVKFASHRIKGKMLDHIASQDEIGTPLRTQAKNLAST